MSSVLRHRTRQGIDLLDGQDHLPGRRTWWEPHTAGDIDRNASGSHRVVENLAQDSVRETDRVWTLHLPEVGYPLGNVGVLDLADRPGAESFTDQLPPSSIVRRVVAHR